MKTFSIKDILRTKCVKTTKGDHRTLHLMNDYELLLLHTTVYSRKTTTRLFQIELDWDGSLIVSEDYGSIVADDKATNIIIAHDKAYFQIFK